MREPIVINAETREITVPETERAFGVAGERKVEVKHIRIEGRTVDGTDLTQGFTWKVSCENAGKELCADLIDGIVADAGNIEFDWIVGAAPMAYKGTMHFAVCAVRVDAAGNILQEWHSQIGHGNVANGIEATVQNIGGQDLLAHIQSITAAAQQNAAAVQALAAEVAANAKIVQENKDAIQNANENIEAIKAAPANAKAAAASAKEARSWAVGDTASRPGEGMDNAKYYAALAQQVSQGAVGWYPNYEALYAAHDTGYDGNWAIIGDTDTIWVWDSDTGVWNDTGESSKFANYYDKTQIDANFYGKTQIDAKLPKPVTVTVAASAWTSGDYTVSWDDGSTSNYTTCATVTVAGVTADSRIAVSDRTRVTDSVRMIAALEPGAGVVKFYANAVPTSAAVFVLEVSQ